MADKTPASRAGAKKPAAAKPKSATKPKATTAKARTKKPVAQEQPVPAAEAAKPELSPEDDLLASMDPNHVMFVEHYLIELNGTKAYKAVFDADMRPNVAASAASRLLTTVNVRRLMSMRVKAMFERTEGLQDQVLTQLFGIAFCDANELSELRRESCRFCYGDGHLWQFKPSEFRAHREDWERAVTRALAENEEPPEWNPKGGEGFDPRREPNDDCPECFGEGVEREFFHDTRHLAPAAKAMYGGVKRTKDGLEIIAHSQEKAREAIHKILKLYDDKAELVMGVVPQEKLDAMYVRAMENAAKGRSQRQGMQREGVDTRREGS